MIIRLINVARHFFAHTIQIATVSINFADGSLLQQYFLIFSLISDKSLRYHPVDSLFPFAVSGNTAKHLARFSCKFNCEFVFPECFAQRSAFIWGNPSSAWLRCILDSMIQILNSRSSVPSFPRMDLEEYGTPKLSFQKSRPANILWIPESGLSLVWNCCTVRCPTLEPAHKLTVLWNQLTYVNRKIFCLNL